VWPSPEVVTLTIFTGGSQLSLPIRQPQPSDALLRPLPEPVASTPSALTVLREGRLERSVTLDQVSGRVNHRMFVDGGTFGPTGKVRLEGSGVEISHVTERNYSIHPDDPNSAVATMTQTCEIGRGDWQTRVDTFAEMTSTATTFELVAWIEAFEGGKSLCRREWKSSIPRKLL